MFKCYGYQFYVHFEQNYKFVALSKIGNCLYFSCTSLFRKICYCIFCKRNNCNNNSNSSNDNHTVYLHTVPFVQKCKISQVYFLLIKHIN
jgi:hypothetical protein